MKKSLEISAHVFFWVVFTAFVYILSKVFLLENPESPLSQHFNYLVSIEVIMGLILFYTTFFGIPAARKKKRNLVLLVTGILSTLVIFAYPATRHGTWEVMSSVIPHIIIIFLALIFRKFSDSIKLENEKQSLLLQNTQSELALLKMQISPHFLFNTLNNIDYLISHDSAKASDSISRLGDILRYMIYDAKVDRIMLSDEINHIEDYIGLIRLRTSGKNYLKYGKTGNAGHLQITPMLFIPLIENAYKHSSCREGENIISIKIIIDGNKFCFLINNEFNSNQVENISGSNGIGLNIVKRRLELIYPGKHDLKISREDNRYNVELNLYLDEY